MSEWLYYIRLAIKRSARHHTLLNFKKYIDELKQTELRTIGYTHQRFEILRSMSNILKAGLALDVKLFS
jgi:hypothetical protein